MSGLEVPFSGDGIVGEPPFEVLVNFDVARSFSQDTSVADRWVMPPHVTAESNSLEPSP